jgi:hypothetical protein
MKGQLETLSQVHGTVRVWTHYMRPSLRANGLRNTREVTPTGVQLTYLLTYLIRTNTANKKITIEHHSVRAVIVRIYEDDWRIFDSLFYFQL